MEGLSFLGDLVTNDVIGSGEATAGGGYYQGTFSILVDFAVSSNKTYAKAVNDEMEVLLEHLILKILMGTKILVLSPADGNNTTSGNSTNVTL